MCVRFRTFLGLSTSTFRLWLTNHEASKIPLALEIGSLAPHRVCTLGTHKNGSKTPCRARAFSAHYGSCLTLSRDCAFSAHKASSWTPSRARAFSAHYGSCLTPSRVCAFSAHKASSWTPHRARAFSAHYRSRCQRLWNSMCLHWPVKSARAAPERCPKSSNPSIDFRNSHGPPFRSSG